MCAISTLFIYLLLTFMLALWGVSCKYTYSWGPSNANNNTLKKKKSPFRAHKNIRLVSKQLIYLGKGNRIHRGKTMT